MTERGTGCFILVGGHRNFRLAARALLTTGERMAAMGRPAHLVRADDLTQQEECDEETDDQGKKHKG